MRLFRSEVSSCKQNRFLFFSENPVLCDENLPKLVGMFEMYYARLMGIAHCIVPQLLPIATDPQSPLIQTPPMELLASIMKPNQQIPLGGSQMPSIVQIIVPANTLQAAPVVLNSTEDVSVATTTLAPTTTTTLGPDALLDSSNDTFSSSTQLPDYSTTVEPLRSSVPVSQDPASTTPQAELEKEDDIEDIQLNEDDSSDDYQDNDERIKKQRDRSDFRYVESFESEKSILQKFEPDPSENDTELKNVINESFQQEPAVLPVPKALSSSKDAESEDREPPDVLPDENSSAPGA